MLPPPPTSTLFPYTTLFRSPALLKLKQTRTTKTKKKRQDHLIRQRAGSFVVLSGDRKSTRLNSSHLVISYAVFCLKKKNHYKVGQAAQQSDVVSAHDQETCA